MHFYNRKYNKILVLFLCFFILFSNSYLNLYATQLDFDNEAEERKNEPVDTNDIENWPEGPKLGCEGAILIDANTGAILYAKNMDEKLFPASTTKIMTSLVAIENCPLDEVIHVNQSAIDANASDGSNMGLYANEELTLDELLHGVLINSANEACNAIAEHIGGSLDGYVDMMNEKAKELGLKNTHFVSTNGLHDENHYTSAYDLAMIAREFFKHETLCKISSTPKYVIHETASHREHYLSSHNKLLDGMELEYQYLVGSKTGFTSSSRQTLVSCAEKDGMKLICVVMKEESPHQFTDTIELFDYGFSNFSEVNVYNNDSTYQINSPEFFNTYNKTLGDTSPITTLNTEDFITLPNNSSFDELTSEIDYSNADDSHFAEIKYYYHGQYVGKTSLSFSDSLKSSQLFYKLKSGPKIINVKAALFNFIIFLIIVIVLVFLFDLTKGFFIHKIRLSKINKNRNNSLSINGKGFSKKGRNFGKTRRRSTLNRVSKENAHAISLTPSKRRHSKSRRRK